MERGGCLESRSGICHGYRYASADMKTIAGLILTFWIKLILYILGLVNHNNNLILASQGRPPSQPQASVRLVRRRLVDSPTYGEPLANLGIWDYRGKNGIMGLHPVWNRDYGITSVLKLGLTSFRDYAGFEIGITRLQEALPICV